MGDQSIRCDASIEMPNDTGDNAMRKNAIAVVAVLASLATLLAGCAMTSGSQPSAFVLEKEGRSP
ncbi:MAG: hypothetical protein MZW92_68220 [Comamonadaceae bacterium]|nr:hypothetical protein [Comamonadaceae bacterium]